MKDEKAENQRKQHARIDERADQLLAQSERHFLKVHIAFKNLRQIARSLAGQKRGRVHQRKSALRLESRRKRFAALDACGNVFDLA